MRISQTHTATTFMKKLVRHINKEFNGFGIPKGFVKARYCPMMSTTINSMKIKTRPSISIQVGARDMQVDDRGLLVGAGTALHHPPHRKVHGKTIG